MGLSEFDNITCKKHPEHRQQPGVCSLCLGEKLSHLSNSSPPHPSQIVRTIVAVSTLSADSSRSSSSSPTPPLLKNNNRRRHHRRHASTDGSLGFIISSNAGGGLKKSRSIAFIEEEEEGKKKGGFWKKLIRSTGKGTKKVFMHSRTVKGERSHAY